MKKLLVGILILISFQSYSQDSWSFVKEAGKGEIVVNYYKSENFISKENGQMMGIEFEIMENFKRFLFENKKIELKISYREVGSFGQLYSDVKEGESGDFGACSFSITEERKKEVGFSPAYMPDIEVLVSSNNLPLFKDTAEFVATSKKYTFLIVPNTTYEEDYNQLAALDHKSSAVLENSSSDVIKKISERDNHLGFAELGNYFVAISEGIKIKRQNIFKNQREGYGIIFPRDSDWNNVLSEYMDDPFYKNQTNLILKKYLGEDIQDLLIEVSNSASKEELLLNKEKEMSLIAIENHKLKNEQQEAEFKMFQAKESRKQLILLGTLGFGVVIILLGLTAYLGKRKSAKIIRSQRNQLSASLTDLTASINYAKRLQLAILPSEDVLRQSLGQGFVLFKPKGVVSGDFYWMKKADNISLLAVADCTGHGVPGAMVSFVCNEALNRSVNEFGLISPAAILNKSRALIIETFARSGENIYDGMDITLCAIEKDKITFASAHHSLFLIRSASGSRLKLENVLELTNERDILYEIRSQRQPCGPFDFQSPFIEKVIEIEKGDLVYLKSDGYIDQFGGEKSKKKNSLGKKFKTKKLKEILLKSVDLDMNEQQRILEKHHNDWKADGEQTDDISIIGLRF